MLFRNLGNGKFEELIDEGGPGVAAVHSSRGCAFGDFDNDGDIDILIVNLNEPPSLLRNDVRQRQSLAEGEAAGREVEPQRDRGARDRALWREGAGAGSPQPVELLFSVSDRRLHFGLGAAEFADLEIRWPNGRKESVAKVPADQLVVIREGAGIIDSPLSAAFKKPAR